MFRPINQGYIQHSEGSGDSYHKPEHSTDSNNSRTENGRLANLRGYIIYYLESVNFQYCCIIQMSGLLTLTN